ncbi:MAG: class I SAM-dependent methyltransferase [Candidatus Micrarchaeaceae archaeon]
MESSLEKFYSVISINYDKVYNILTFGLGRVWRRKMLKKLGASRSATVLDLATGTGETAIAIAKHYKNYKVIGLDFNAKMLKIAKEKSRGLKNVRYIEGDAEKYKGFGTKFDYVTSTFSLGEFEDLRSVIGNIFDMLKPGGKVLLMDLNAHRSTFIRRLINTYYYFRIMPISQSEIKNEIERYVHSSYFEVNMENVVALLKQAGFSNIEKESLGFGLGFMIAAEKPLMR